MAGRTSIYAGMGICRDGYMQGWVYAGMGICRDGYMQGWVYAGMGAERGGGAATARHVRDAEVIQYVQATPCSRTIIYTRR